MSISNINNKQPYRVPWANLGCNTLSCNELTVLKPIEAIFPSTTQNLPIGAAVNSITDGLVFNVTSNQFPNVFSQVTTGALNPYIKVDVKGRYLINVDLSNIAMSNTAGSYGPITLVFKTDYGTGTYSEIAEQTMDIPDQNTLVSYSITKIVNVSAANTKFQVLFRRGAAAANPGTVVVAENSASAISFFKLA